jgi:hypothetical protein
LAVVKITLRHSWIFHCLDLARQGSLLCRMREAGGTGDLEGCKHSHMIEEDKAEELFYEEHEGLSVGDVPPSQLRVEFSSLVVAVSSRSHQRSVSAQNKKCNYVIANRDVHGCLPFPSIDSSFSSYHHFPRLV